MIKFTKQNFSLLILLCVLLLLDITAHSLSLIDRKGIHRTEAANRQMLDARARIQIAIVATGLRRGVFTTDEKCQIARNWDTAEYSMVTPKSNVIDYDAECDDNGSADAASK